jgi:hypothetical protein
MKTPPRKSAVNPAPARMIYCRDARPTTTILRPLSTRSFPAPARTSRVLIWSLAVVVALAAAAPLLAASLAR